MRYLFQLIRIIMDLNEQTYVQCFNCHSNIFRKPSDELPQTNNSICQTCLSYQSRETTALQQNIQTMQNQVGVLKNGFDKQIGFYTGQNHNQGTNYSIEELERQLEELQRQSADMDKVQTQLDFEISAKIDHFKKTNSCISQQADLMKKQQEQLYALVQTKAILDQQVGDLRVRKERLMAVSILSEFYPIHFDDKSAFVNRQAITFQNLTPILQIILHLMDKYDYRSFTINFCQNLLILKNGSQQSLDNADRQQTIPWLQVVVKETILLWEHIKLRSSQKMKQSYESYALPFKIGLQPELSINGNTLNSDTSYSKFFKYFTHNLKFMMAFDFEMESKSWSKGGMGGLSV